MSFQSNAFFVLVMFTGLLAAAPQAAGRDSDANFRAPQRHYVRSPGDLNIYVERSLAADNRALSVEAQEKLRRNLQQIFAVLPARPANKLKHLRFYLMWGTDAPEGGLASGMAYVRDGEPRNYPHLDPTWNDAIIIYSAKNLVYLDPVWTKKALMHELAHAWHIQNWPEEYEPIKTAYLRANALGLYRNVRDNKGKLTDRAYAMRNQLEYFAELSAMYFVGGNYFPFNRAALAKYDPTGEAMVRLLWNR